MTTETPARGQLSIRVVAMPADTNPSGDIFGGWLVSHMDLAGMSEAIRHCLCRVVTVAINSLTFIKPVAVGDLVCCYTRLLKIGRTSMQFKIECWVLSLNQQEEVKVAEGEFVYVAVNDKGQPQPVKR